MGQEVVIVDNDGTEHVFPEGFDPKKAAAIVKAAIPSHESQPESQPMGGWLPTAGGFVGSLVGTPFGPPGRLVGATAGGALGKGAEMLLDNQPQSISEGLTAMGTEGAKQGAAEGLGIGVGKLFKAGAPRLMQSMLKPTQALRNSFPTVAQDAVDAGISIGRGGQAKVGRLISASAGKVDSELAKAQAAGASPILMKDVLTELAPVSQKIAQEPISAAKLSQLSDIGAQALKENPNPIPLTAAQPMKQAAQRVAKEGYKKVAAGADVNSVGPDANMAIARGLRKEIEKRAPAVGPMNAQTQKLMGVEDALEHALGRIANNQPIGMNDALSVILGTGGYNVAGAPGIGAGLLMKALTTPATSSRIAIGMDRLAPIASHAPNLTRAALLAALQQQQGQ